MDTITITDELHRSSLELWFADLGLEVTEVERCPDLECEVCGAAEPRRAGDPETTAWTQAA